MNEHLNLSAVSRGHHFLGRVDQGDLSIEKLFFLLVLGRDHLIKCLSPFTDIFCRYHHLLWRNIGHFFGHFHVSFGYCCHLANILPLLKLKCLHIFQKL